MDKRSFLVTCVLALLAAFCSAGMCAEGSAAGEWPAWRGPKRDGVSTETGWQAQFPASGPKMAWRATVGVGFSSCSVAAGRVYTMGNEANNDIVWCLDAATGKETWTHRYPCKPGDYPGSRMTPTVDGDLVFTLGREGQLFCLGAKDGAVTWSKDVHKDFGVKPEPYKWGLSCSPLVMGDLLILDLGKIIALDKKTGSVAWSIGDDKPGFSSPVVFELNGTPYVTSFNPTGLLIGNIKSRAEAARHPWETEWEVNAATPIVLGDKIFISSGYNRGCTLLQFDGSSLKALYENKNMRNHANNCVLYEGHLYGLDGQFGENGNLRCLDFATGAVKWSEGKMKPGGLMIADGKIIAMLDGGELLIAEASPAAFKPLARAKVLSGQCWTYPVLAGGRIYCRSNKGKELVCVDVSGR